MGAEDTGDSFYEGPTKVARREHVVSDQGNGRSYCGHCEKDLGSDPTVHFDRCPGCNYLLIEGDVTIQRGGSDFD